MQPQTPQDYSNQNNNLDNAGPRYTDEEAYPPGQSIQPQQYAQQYDPQTGQPYAQPAQDGMGIGPAAPPPQTLQQEEPIDYVVHLVGKPLRDYTPMDRVAELQIIDVRPGRDDEEPVRPGATVKLNYIGALLNTGMVFQSSFENGKTVIIPLESVIAGWAQGIPGMKVGGSRRLLIPAALAYGEQSPSAVIPPNSDLVFDIDLIRIIDNPPIQAPQQRPQVDISEGQGTFGNPFA